MNLTIFQIIDMLGTAAFSISGVFAAMEKKLDLFGIFIIAFITSVGGGIIRDVMIGDLPVNWMRSGNYALVIFVSAVIAVLFNKSIRNLEKILVVFDALGIGFFTIVGIQKGIQFNFSPAFCVALGTITACFGGLVRDVILNQIPQIFHKEIYATACILGGILYFLLLKTNLPQVVIDGICITTIFVIRMIGVKYKLSLPNIYGGSNSK